MTDTVTITTELSNSQALALVQFVKRPHIEQLFPADSSQPQMAPVMAFTEHHVINPRLLISGQVIPLQTGKPRRLI